MSVFKYKYVFFFLVFVFYIQNVNANEQINKEFQLTKSSLEYDNSVWDKELKLLAENLVSLDLELSEKIQNLHQRSILSSQSDSQCVKDLFIDQMIKELDKIIAWSKTRRTSLLEFESVVCKVTPEKINLKKPLINSSFVEFHGFNLIQPVKGVVIDNSNGSMAYADLVSEKIDVSPNLIKFDLSSFKVTDKYSQSYKKVKGLKQVVPSYFEQDQRPPDSLYITIGKDYKKFIKLFQETSDYYESMAKQDEEIGKMEGFVCGAIYKREPLIGNNRRFKTPTNKFNTTAGGVSLNKRFVRGNLKRVKGDYKFGYDVDYHANYAIGLNASKTEILFKSSKIELVECCDCHNVGFTCGFSADSNSHWTHSMNVVLLQAPENFEFIENEVFDQRFNEVVNVTSWSTSREVKYVDIAYREIAAQGRQPLQAKIMQDKYEFLDHAMVSNRDENPFDITYQLKANLKMDMVRTKNCIDPVKANQPEMFKGPIIIETVIPQFDLGGKVKETNKDKEGN